MQAVIESINGKPDGVEFMDATGGRANALVLFNALLGSFDRLVDLEVGGRAAVTMMRGHSADIRLYSSTREYLARLYTRVGREFVQYGGHNFVLHHCARCQFIHMREEFDSLQAGPLGDELADLSVELPRLTRPVTPGRRDAIATVWYMDVYNALAHNQAPHHHGQRRKAITAEECKFKSEEFLDTMWPQFHIWVGEIRARQIVVCWDILRSLVQLHQLVESSMSRNDLHDCIQDQRDGFRGAGNALTAKYHAWHNLHAGSIDVHDPMYDRNVDDLYGWIRSLTPTAKEWDIKDDVKDEMYVELASAMLKLRRATPPNVNLAPPTYWRRLPFTPECNRVGAPGMPPFSG